MKLSNIIVLFIALFLISCSDSSSSSSSNKSYASVKTNTPYVFVGWGDTSVTQTATDLVIDVTFTSSGGSDFPINNDFTNVIMVMDQDGTLLDTTIVRITSLGLGSQTVNVTVPLSNINGVSVTLGVQADVFEEVVDKESDWRILSSFTKVINVPYSG